MAKTMTYRYDREADVLYIDLGGHEPAYFEETTEGYLLGKGLFSGSLVEIRIVGWQKAGSQESRARGGQASVGNRVVMTEAESWPKASKVVSSATGSRTLLERREEVLVA